MRYLEAIGNSNRIGRFDEGPLYSRGEGEDIAGFFRYIAAIFTHWQLLGLELELCYQLLVWLRASVKLVVLRYTSHGVVNTNSPWRALHIVELLHLFWFLQTRSRASCPFFSKICPLTGKVCVVQLLELFLIELRCFAGNVIAINIRRCCRIDCHDV